MTRREFLAAAGSAAWLAQAAASNPPRMGGSPTAFSVRMHAAQPFDIIEHCHNLGLSGTETSRPPSTPESQKTFRQKLETYHMRVIFNVPLPRKKENVNTLRAE